MNRFTFFTSLYLLPIALYAQLPLNQEASHKSITILRNQIGKIAQDVQGRVGVAAAIVETGELVEWHGKEQYPMQSVYKMPIGMAVLHLVDEGKVKLTQSIRVEPAEYVSKGQRSPLRDEFPNGTNVTVAELLRLAVSESDGSASDVLMRIAGGAQVIMTYLKTLNVTGINVANTEKEIGSDNTVQYRNWATPTEAVSLLTSLQIGRGLSTESRALLLRLMTDTPTGLKRLKGLLPKGTSVAHKTGSSGTVNNVAAATNDIGLITLPSGQHLAIAVFVSDSKADDVTREAVIARIAKAVWEWAKG
ncbi:class A beta-lactamase [Spirosoma sp. BT702]|uniref:Beta-lactamase n=1 Tax=Spirosoma profusum TaxID=2771354 RepID=A0A927AQG1_9BACT|nr:class A beta-lactamase [Spirosoma profusum]MBD2700393.1 class A beta-lactamase [Spirosoma profusum]